MTSSYDTEEKKTRTRWYICMMLFVMTTINYADRATLSLAGTAASKELGMSAVALGYIFSAFGWSYVILQIPGGWLLDRFGSKRVYFWSILLWSIATFMQGYVGLLGTAMASIIALFTLRLLLGAFEAPSFPANSRLVAAWFPKQERGTAAAIFNSAQYFATVLFAPIMGYIVQTFGWQHVFSLMGGLGVISAFVWLKVVYAPKDHPGTNKAELDYIEQGGAVVNMDQKQADDKSCNTHPTWWCLKRLLGNRMLVGVYIGQYCITTLTYFFLTWFPVYLVKARGMSILKAGFVAVLPALFGFIGGILGGLISDYLLRKGYSLSAARKTPIVLGMLLSTAMIACNYTSIEWLVVVIMAMAFFGKGVGALGWAVVSDTSPKEIAGLSGGLFNTFGNTAGITTPIIIGYIVQGTGSFNGALVFVGANALGAILSYLLIVGEIKRMELKRGEDKVSAVPETCS